MNTTLLSVFLVILALLSSCQSDYFDLMNDNQTTDNQLKSHSTGFTFPNGWH